MNRSVEITVNWSDYRDLETLGIDEIALKKGYSDYLTIISVKDKNDILSVVAVLPDRLKKTVKTLNLLLVVCRRKNEAAL